MMIFLMKNMLIWCMTCKWSHLNIIILYKIPIRLSCCCAYVENYMYGKCWNKWPTYCDGNGINVLYTEENKNMKMLRNACNFCGFELFSFFFGIRFSHLMIVLNTCVLFLFPCNHIVVWFACVWFECKSDSLDWSSRFD